MLFRQRRHLKVITSAVVTLTPLWHLIMGPRSAQSQNRTDFQPQTLRPTGLNQHKSSFVNRTICYRYIFGCRLSVNMVGIREYIILFFCCNETGRVGIR